MPFTLRELAELTSSKLVGDQNLLVSNVNTLEDASLDEISFLANTKYKEQLKTTKAIAVCVAQDAPLEEGKNYLISANPSYAFQQIAEAFYDKKAALTGFTSIHPSAVVHESAKIGKNVHIGPLVIVDQNVTIGDNSKLFGQIFIGACSKIGFDCIVHPGCIIREKCELGNRVILQPGVVLGSCGFGYSTNAKGEHIKLEQLGIVVLEDDVEIGANSTIDRARFKETRIKTGSKIDNLVQIAHNVQIGKGNLIAAQSGIAGSSKTGNFVMMGGQVGILGHVEIGDCAMLATRAGVSKSLEANGKYRGSPAIDIHEYHRQEAHVRKLADYVKKIKELEKKVEELEKKFPS